MLDLERLRALYSVATYGSASAAADSSRPMATLRANRDEPIRSPP